MQSPKTIHCEILTPDGITASGDYVCVTVPALDGSMGILANRAPIAAVVTTGLVKLRDANDKDTELFVSKGFLRVASNRATILAEECCKATELDPEKAWDILQKAYKMPRDTKAQEAIREEAIAAARIRFSIAQKARKAMGSLADVFSKGL